MTRANPTDCWGEEDIFSLDMFWQTSIMWKEGRWISKFLCSMCYHQNLGTTKYSSFNVTRRAALFAIRNDDVYSNTCSGFQNLQNHSGQNLLAGPYHHHICLLP